MRRPARRRGAQGAHQVARRAQARLRRGRRLGNHSRGDGLRLRLRSGLGRHRVGRRDSGEVRPHRLEVREQLVHGLVPLLAALRHAAQDDPLQLGRDLELGAQLPGRHRRVVQVLEDDVDGSRSGERHPAGEHVVEQHSQRIDVAALVRALVPRLLRGDVVRRPHERPGIGDVGLGVVAGEKFHQAEVQHLHEVVIVVLPEQHDVGRLQVAVDDPERVRLAQRTADLLRNVDHAFLRQRAVRLDRLGERPAVEKLHGDEEDPVVGAAVVVQGDGVRVRQLGGDARFQEEALVEVRVAIVAGAQDLQRHHPIQRRLQCLVNPAHPAMTDGLDDLVSIVQHPPEQRIRLCGGGGVGGRLSTRHRAELLSRAGPPSAVR